ncbi:Co2+/Mg2+ efflux protein ApaG [Uliginosibacterium sp. H3]|uniref:Protein ApaG n=1 Tax=Uliginosibacterium silvisoli TaxID=3114758 RepID=A0ABU6K389_9RHOO|nr:Co2+/Mg2+ efflux protein ApaG [Uliginosibacterium sp. H3]
MDNNKYLIHVETSAEFIADQSSPDEGRFVFAYQIRIENKGKVPAKLISRHWLITDAEGRVQEVRGVGVIGEQPTIAPGESFEYTSGCSIATPVGTMRGEYQMTAEDGTDFDADIPEFLLPGPRVLH